MIVKIDTATLIGSRKEQMDRYFVGKEMMSEAARWDTTREGPLCIGVLDGVGSLPYSGLAASLAGEKIAATFYGDTVEDDVRTPAERLKDACGAGCDKVDALNRSLGSFASATTITAAVIKDDVLSLCAVGDSPAYLWRGKKLVPLFEPQVGASGQLAGYAGQKDPEFATAEVKLQPKDKIALCTDGVFCGKLLKVLHWCLNLGCGADRIIKLSTQRAGADNATIILLTVEEEEKDEETGN